MDNCAICNAEINTEESAILTMGAYGNPKYLCKECSLDMDTATLGKEVAEISAAMERISKKMTVSGPDKQTYTTVTGLMAIAHDRAQKIKEGEYDFSLDESDESEGGFDEIPEELAESEEDKEKDRDRLRQYHVIRMQCFRAFGDMRSTRKPEECRADYEKAIEEIDNQLNGTSQDIGLLLEKAQIYMEMEEFEKNL